jgi:hypothetical protein
MRNRLARDGVIKSGVAPSYFIEGMLHNVPVNQFGGSYQKTIENCWNWINATKASDLMCANGQHPLVHDDATTSWSVKGFGEFMNGVKDLWNQWK